MISHSLRLAVAVAVVVTVASWATGQDRQDPTPQPLMDNESMANRAEKPSAKADGELLRLEQQLAAKERRLVLEEKQVQLQQRQRTLEEMKRNLDPKRLRVRHEQAQRIAAQRSQQRATRLKGLNKEREQQAKAEPVVKIFRLQRDRASDQMAIVRLIAPKVQVIFHARTNSIIALGPEPQLHKVEALLRKLDEMETATVDPQVQLPTPLPAGIQPRIPSRPGPEFQLPRTSRPEIPPPLPSSSASSTAQNFTFRD